MTPRPTWVRKFYTTLAIAVALGLMGMGYACLQIVAAVDPGSSRPNEFDAKEADRKLRLYRDALAITRRGFVRLSEVEINSYLQTHYFSKAADGVTEGGAEPVRLLRSRVDLTDGGLLWICWLRKPVWGRSVELVWEREFKLNRKQDRWLLEPESMRVGRMDVPRSLWPIVEKELGAVDKVFSRQADWLARIPSLEIRTNDTSLSPEVRLFTYTVAKSPGQ